MFNFKLPTTITKTVTTIVEHSETYAATSDQRIDAWTEQVKRESIAQTEEMLALKRELRASNTTDADIAAWMSQTK